MGTGLEEAVIKGWRGELNEAPSPAEEPARWRETQGVDNAEGASCGLCLPLEKRPWAGHFPSRASPGRQGDDAYGAFLAVWALVSCPPPSRLFCILLHVELTPCPTMSEGPVCLQGLGQWPGVRSAVCLSLPTLSRCLLCAWPC